MTYNVFGRCVVKCVCFEELNAMQDYGSPGLSYLPDWAPANLMRQTHYPVYVSVDLYGHHGAALYDISQSEPDERMQERVEVLCFADFIKRQNV